MRLKGRKILLLVDNAPVHALYEGIINNFKAHYRKLLLQNHIKAFDFQQETGNSKSPINIKKAIKYVVSAWNKVLSKTIFNCWKDAGILPLDDTDSQDEIEKNEHKETEENERREIQDLIDKLEYTYPLTAEEYIRIDQENEIDGETLTEEQIVAILKENNSISDNKSDSEITLVSSSEQTSLNLFVKSNNSVDGIGNNNMREGVKDNIMDVDNINFETLYFNERDFYNHEEEYEGFIEYQIDQDCLYK
ncbi:hypothetical protein RirG_017340 [Rhizophagus irregularis DAOM 197198w]|uniref:DDE-1 domain-containing protein n=1 Tax=Rhizophagus irregularis (strain DAOM 197198w) TaxID=1432141 RepID=A0A015K8Y8_RHIIW|nr:hypothetical protein RirG_017340 [Rhizophagus irregularis DAOM 197198w]